MIAGTLRAFEKGFQRLISSHHPETESPKFRGELSSICSISQTTAARNAIHDTHRANVGCNDRTCAHRHHGRDLR